MHAKTDTLPRYDRYALVLQGGGALGAYQAGVYEELTKTPYRPDWVAGVSIGAVNAAIIAGNAPEQRVSRLREFWRLLSSGFTGAAPSPLTLRRAYNAWSALWSAFVGVPGFYRPHRWSYFLRAHELLGLYDNAGLAHTLERCVDFERINRGDVRLSVGAVNVETGNSVYFDNHTVRIGPEHIIASGALPPAFAPVVIDGASYWDGGIVSNTPLHYVLEARAAERLLVLQVDLFSARGSVPVDLFSVVQRHKDIMYSSRTRYNTDKVQETQNNLRALAQLIRRLPADLRQEPDVRRLEERANRPGADIVHLIYRQQAHEHASKDYEFSRASVLEHWQAGRRDMRRSFEHPDFLARASVDVGVTTYDLADDVGEPHIRAPRRVWRRGGKPHTQTFEE